MKTTLLIVWVFLLPNFLCAQNIGIGTSNPQEKLHVAGKVRIDDLPVSINPVFIITADSLGNLFKIAFTTQSSGTTGVPKMVTYTANSVWYKSTGLQYVIVEVVGGGGGGGGCYTYGGGPGAGGGYARRVIDADSLGSSVVITIGVGGSGGGQQTPGSNGGTSSFGNYCSATGGSGGKANTSTVYSSEGSDGGIGINGDFNLKGGDSGGATGSGQPLYQGGSSYFGDGAMPRGNQSPNHGIGSITFGTGGGGGNCAGSVNLSGGAGAPGVIIVTELF